ncbi:MAG TPA: beta-galactosidase [bacterium]|nr:beta-galactosidase [bacterium]
MERNGEEKGNFLIGLGGAFYPEHHPEETWPALVRLAGQAGLKAVRIGEFAWDRMEPVEGQYDFAWLDKVFRLLAEENIQVVLCTPTAVPPIWACQRYPEIFPVLEDGRTFGFGVRRYTCPSSPEYRRLCRNIVTAMARHFGQNSQVFAWQIDNELGHPFCFCSRCLKSFRQWCQKQFGTIEAFNEAMVLSFWGQTLKSFEQINFPNSSHHPGLWQAYHRFFSEITIDCFRLQVETLRQEGVKVPITTNMMLTWHGYNHEVFGRSLDVIAGDHYGLGRRSLFAIGGDAFVDQSFVHSFLRGIKGGQPPWFLEFQWGRGAGLPAPGRVRWAVLTQASLGTEFISFFRFDTCPSGQERNWGGLVEVSLKTGRIYQEVSQLNRELNVLREKLKGASPGPAEVALLFSHENHCEFARNHHPEFFAGPMGNGYALHLDRHFAGLVGQNLRVDIVHPGADWSRYRLLVVAGSFILPKSLAEKLTDYVKEGGILLMTGYSAQADENGKIWSVPLPAHLTEVFGVEVRDYGEVLPEVTGPVTMLFRKGKSCPGKVLWLEELEITGQQVETLAYFQNKFYGRIPALTRNNHGRGQALYFGGVLDETGYLGFYRKVARLAGLKPPLLSPEGVHVTEWRKGTQRYYFVNNPSSQRKKVVFAGKLQEAVSGQKVKQLVLPAFEVRLLKKLDR